MDPISVRVTPRSSQNKVVVEGDQVRVWTTAPPVDGDANAAVCELIARALHVPKSSVQVVAGETSRNKRIQIHGLSAVEAMSILTG